LTLEEKAPNIGIDIRFDFGGALSAPVPVCFASHSLALLRASSAAFCSIARRLAT
jgi:hypothetical protein